jgi:hypothetical protein
MHFATRLRDGAMHVEFEFALVPRAPATPSAKPKGDSTATASEGGP